MRELSDAGLAFLHKEEGLVGHPYWPGGASGVTLDLGYDLGYVELQDFVDDWQSKLDPAHFRLMTAVLGFRGRNAEIALRAVKHIPINKITALGIFERKSYPRYAKQALSIYPQADKLGDGPWTALFSLVYNRGGRLADDDPLRPETWRREEMRVLQQFVAEGNLPKMADLFVIMGRLWEKSTPGLTGRREREAVLIDPTVKDRLPELRKMRRE